MKQLYAINYRFRYGGSTQTNTLLAKDEDHARLIFKQRFPLCRILDIKKMKRRKK